ncbi:BN159_2729 family protein [Streptomyces sp. NPDC006193]|uniref:BN159_2729 family protein n=1 Tax=Streptomyces sp. NPDC006193 TaxID=3155717 RepID=UPI0033AE6648
MNTIENAVRVVREVMASSGIDPAPATAIVRALDEVGLLANPERPGIVLHRAPAGGSTSGTAPALTELEQQALAWDQSCERARQVAAAIEAHISQHPEFQSIRTDGDRVLVALHVTDQAQWDRWRRYFGIRHDQERPLPHLVAGDGHRDGVRVSVVAYDVPLVRTAAAERAGRPFQLDGIVYDLALPQRDAQGGLWVFKGQRAEDGMPLLSLDGRPERCSLANVVTQVGPLTPVTDTPSTQVTPVTGEGGEEA